MKREAANHLQTLLAMIEQLPVAPTPIEVGRIQGQATKLRIWCEPEDLGQEAACITQK